MEQDTPLCSSCGWLYDDPEDEDGDDDTGDDTGDDVPDDSVTEGWRDI
ncbi:MAG: hypothetical protein O2782_15905 [bacterium]|nr:hypothetical protein [bacterium]